MPTLGKAQALLCNCTVLEVNLPYSSVTSTHMPIVQATQKMEEYDVEVYTIGLEIVAFFAKLLLLQRVATAMER